MCTFLGEGERDLTAEAAPAAGDDGDLIFEFHVPHFKVAGIESDWAIDERLSSNHLTAGSLPTAHSTAEGRDFFKPCFFE